MAVYLYSTVFSLVEEVASSILLTVQYRSICLYKFLYDLMKGEYLIHTEEAEGKTLNGESRIVVNKDGNDIIVF